MLYKIFDGVIENNPYESEIEFIEEEITNIKHKIQLCNEALNDKKKKLKEIERKCKIKQREIEYNKWINDLEIKQEYDMLKLAKQQIFFDISDCLFEKYSHKIIKKSKQLFIVNLCVNFDSWELIEKSDKDEIHMFVITEKHLCSEKQLNVKFDMDVLILPNIMKHISDNLPIHIFHSTTKSYFISEKLKNNGFNIYYSPETIHTSFNLLLEYYQVK